MSAPATAPPTPAAASPEERIRHLARLLRGVGAAVLLAAASTFLVQQWADAGDVSRYLGLLGLTGLLAAAGLLVGVGIRESRSARTFLALAAATVPAHFAIVGGLLYSQWATPGSGLPTASYAVWQAPSPAAALGVAGLACAILAPIVQLAFTALARSRALPATAVLFATGALMWIPVRDPHWSALLVAVMCAGLAAFELRALRRAPGLRTVEGGLLRLVLAAPPALVALRGLLHYEFSWFLAAVLCAVGALGAGAVAAERRVPLAWRRLAEGGALAAGVGTFLSLAFGLDAAFRFPESAMLLALGLPCAAGLGAMAALVPERRRAYGAPALWVALGTVGLDLALFAGSASTLVALVVGIVALADGFVGERRAELVAGGAVAVLSLGIQVSRAAAHYSWGAWGALALLGVLVIVVAALLERHHEWLRDRVRLLRTRVASWEY